MWPGEITIRQPQVDAIERALESDQECAGVLQLMVACRGALDGLMAEVMEGTFGFTSSLPTTARPLCGRELLKN
jgi:hypothetical protein